MTSSISQQPDRGLDTMILVYSLVQGHPAMTTCEQLLRAHSGWFMPLSVLFEAKAILTRVYGEDPAVVTQKLEQVVLGPVPLIDLAPTDIIPAFQLADAHGLDLTDAALLRLCLSQGASLLVTDDHRLSVTATRLGLMPVSPISVSLSQAIASWEASQFPPKGMQRVLRRVHEWISQRDPHVAQDFWSATGATSHLP